MKRSPGRSSAILEADLVLWLTLGRASMRLHGASNWSVASVLQAEAKQEEGGSGRLPALGRTVCFQHLRLQPVTLAAHYETHDRVSGMTLAQGQFEALCAVHIRGQK